MTDRTLAVTLPPADAEIPVVGVAGDLDYHTASELRKALETVSFPAGSGVVIDLSGLAFCDSTGITVLIAAYRRAQAAGSALLLAGANADLVQVLRIIGLEEIFSLHPTVDDAIGALNQS
ncbi:STAS domain-containing protein [Actinomadura fibrosa]|uniref:Anti-sigma factor antagonist n=1 Tax=Actinomadura fibrosa TaxID=111802 RepID=A0ABW2XMU7_9ACTN|nr:STAS domain-containing protein [Actinomadura fibrosa]